jgi:hypothetical protein
VLVAASLYAELVPGSVRDVAKCFVAGWSDHQYPTMTAAFPGWLADISPATGQQLPLEPGRFAGISLGDVRRGFDMIADETRPIGDMRVLVEDAGNQSLAPRRGYSACSTP